MKLLYGTGNPAKLDVMRRRLADLGIELIGLKDLGEVRLPEIIEDGKTPLDNGHKLSPLPPANITHFIAILP